MILYLLRHADAIDLVPDAARPLSKKGRHQVEALAKFLAKSGAFAPEAIWHSPLVRAVETATLLADALGLKAKRTAVPGLTPEDDPRAIARKLATGPAALALVGHEPHMSALASLLITGEPLPAVFVFKKCAMVALEGEGGHWAVRWHVSPEVLG
jgi:phosphohistidine phosphatase